MKVGSRFRGRLVLALVFGALPTQVALAGESIGRVVSIDGDVFAEASEEEPRRLRCGDAIQAEDTVTTTSGGRLGVLVGSVHARLSDSSQARFGLTPQQAPAFFLEVGRLHVVDARIGDPPPMSISARGLRAEAAGSDTDVWVGDLASFTTTTLCESAADLHVTLESGAGSLVVSPEQCAQLAPGGKFAKQSRQLAPLGGAGDPCDDLLGPVALYYRDPGVDAPPPTAFPQLRPAPDPPRGPCDNPWGCASVPSSDPPPLPPGPPIVEQPVVGCQIPGLCTP